MFREIVIRPGAKTAWCALILLLAACAGRTTPAPGLPADTPTPLPAQPLVIWHALSGADQSTLEQISASFQAAHPAIAVQVEAFDAPTLVQRYQEAVRAGAGPDLLLGTLEALPALVEAGAVRPIAAPTFDALSDVVPEAAARAAFVSGTPYAVPFSAALATLYFNRTLLPAAPESEAALFAAAGTSGWLIVPSFPVTAGWYRPPGGPDFVTTPAVQDYLAALQSLAAQPGIRFSHDPGLFLRGEVALLLASSAEDARLRAALGDRLGAIPLPRRGTEPWRTLFDLLPILENTNSTTAAIQGADQFLVYLLSADAQRVWYAGTGRVPINPAALDDGLLRTAWQTALETGYPAPLDPQFAAQIEPRLDAAVRAVVLEGADPQAAAGSVLAAPAP